MADSIFRRTDDTMELLLDKRGSTTQYIRVQTSPDMLTWTTRIDIPAKQSPPNPGLGESFRGKVFHRLTLSDYTLTVPLFIRFQDIDNTVAVTTSQVYLALETARGDQHFWLVSGTAPQGAALANSICVVIPPTVDFAVENVDSSSHLFVAFSETGPEKNLAKNDLFSIKGRVKQVWLRGSGGDADFELRVSSQR